jgi:hypothetical protein
MFEGKNDTVRVRELRVILDRYKRDITSATDAERQILSRIISELTEAIEHSLTQSRQISSDGFSTNSLLVQ